MAAQLGADLLDLVGVVQAADGLEVRLAGLALADPVGGEGAGLDVLQDALHLGARLSVIIRGPDTYSPYSAVLEIE